MITFLWAASLTAIISFCIVFTYKIAHLKGYKAGADWILGEWKNSINGMENDRDE